MDESSSHFFCACSYFLRYNLLFCNFCWLILQCYCRGVSPTFNLIVSPVEKRMMIHENEKA